RVRPRGLGDAPRRRGPREPDGSAWHRALDRRHLPDHVLAASRRLAPRRPGPRDRGARAPRTTCAADVRCARDPGALVVAPPGDRREDPVARLPVGPRALLTKADAILGGDLDGRSERHVKERLQIAVENTNTPVRHGVTP